MEVLTLCIQILSNVFVLLSTRAGHSCAAQKPDFPKIFPDQLQFFRFDSVSFSCDWGKHMNAWRVVRKLYHMSPNNISDGCNDPAPSCTIDPAFETHSGEYWCENDDGERSQALNISVTDGRVILKFTAQPVTEGSDVNLYCFNNFSPMKTSDFYKDGQHLITSFDNNILKLQKVSKADEGLYNCSMSGVGESKESWLNVVKPEKESYKDTIAQYLIYVPLCTLGCLFCSVIGLIVFRKHKALRNETSTDLNRATYAVVNKPRKKNGRKATDEQEQVTYAT